MVLVDFAHGTGQGILPTGTAEVSGVACVEVGKAQRPDEILGCHLPGFFRLRYQEPVTRLAKDTAASQIAVPAAGMVVTVEIDQIQSLTSIVDDIKEIFGVKIVACTLQWRGAAGEM